MSKMNEVTLRDLVEADIPLFHSWWNDDELRSWTSDSHEFLDNASIDEIMLGHLSKPAYHDFIIDLSGRAIGHILIQQRKNNDFTLYVAIGEKDCWGKRYGTTAVKLICEYFDSTFPDQSLLLDVNQNNARAITCYKKCGFVLVGEKNYGDHQPQYVMEYKKP